MEISHLTPIEDAQYDEIEELMDEQKGNLSEEEHYEIELSLLNLEFDQFPKIIEFLKSKRL
jgi:frataxin-like iron-binding protein CyaY